MSLLGVKRTFAVAPHMSAFDPKRTSHGLFQYPNLIRYDGPWRLGGNREATRVHQISWRGCDSMATLGALTAGRAPAHRRVRRICRERPRGPVVSKSIRA